MAKQNNSVEATASANNDLEMATNDAANAPALHDESLREQALMKLEMFSEKPKEELISLSGEYLKLQENTTYNFLFTGFTTFETKNGETKEAVKLSNRDKNYINGAAVLVSTLKRKVDANANVLIPVRVITKGSKTNAAGTYMEMEVFILE
jgi:hypothetical protein